MIHTFPDAEPPTRVESPRYRVAWVAWLALILLALSGCRSPRARVEPSTVATVGMRPVRFSEAMSAYRGLSLEAVREASPAGLVDPEHGYDGVSLQRGRRVIHGVRTWRDFGRWTRRGFQPVDGINLRMSGAFATLAAVVEVLESARPSRLSFLEELPDDAELLRVLDPRLGITVSQELIDRAEEVWRAGQGFLDVFPESRVEERIGGRIVIREGEDDNAGRVVLTPVAWGDMNGDGVEDLVVAVWHETGGSLGYGFHTTLMRASAQGRILRTR